LKHIPVKIEKGIARAFWGRKRGRPPQAHQCTGGDGKKKKIGKLPSAGASKGEACVGGGVKRGTRLKTHVCKNWKKRQTSSAPPPLIVT